MTWYEFKNLKECLCKGRIMWCDFCIKEHIFELADAIIASGAELIERAED